jgi:hypothetical protein
MQNKITLAKFQCLETTVTNQEKLRVGKFEQCLHYSVQNLLSSRLQIKLMLSVAFQGRETWSFIHREEHILTVSDKKSEEKNR